MAEVEIITTSKGIKQEKMLVKSFELNQNEMSKGFLRTRIVKNGMGGKLEVFTLKTIKLTPEEKAQREKIREAKRKAREQQKTAEKERKAKKREERRRQRESENNKIRQEKIQRAEARLKKLKSQ